MGDNQQASLRAGPESESTRLVLGMIRVGVGYGQGIVEDCRCLMKRHAMLGKIFRGLPRIPLELQFALLASFTTNQ